MLGDVQRLLTTTEIAGFLAFHPLTAARVAAFNTAVAVLGFDQIYSPPAWYEFDVAVIPPSGLCVTDSTYGNVLVAPNAQGTLYYNAFVDDAHCAAAERVVNDGETTSPSDWLGLFSNQLGSLGTMALLGVGVYFYLNRKKK